LGFSKDSFIKIYCKKKFEYAKGVIRSRKLKGNRRGRDRMAV